MEKIDNNSKKENVLKLTWQGIIDYLTEEKALFSLENMYLIEYENIVNQELKGVEYIGIQKLQAELILDDGLRNSLNTWLEIIQQQENKFIKVWLLEEFIKGKPLLPLFYKNMQLYLSGKLNRFNTSRLIYSAAIDKVVSSINSDNRKPVFSDDFFEKHKKTLELVKSHSREYFKIKNTIWNLFSSLSDKDRLSFAYRLFTRLKKNQKYSFVNELLKELNNVKGEVKPIIEHIFKNLLPNDKTWQSEAIPIIAGLIKGGVSNEE